MSGRQLSLSGTGCYSLPAMADMTPGQLATLERLAARGFRFVAFPLYASYIGVRKGNCAALLSAKADGLEILGEASFLIEENLSVRIKRGARELFVFKQKTLEATAARLRELDSFRKELQVLLVRSS